MVTSSLNRLTFTLRSPSAGNTRPSPSSTPQAWATGLLGYWASTSSIPLRLSTTAPVASSSLSPWASRSS